MNFLCKFFFFFQFLTKSVDQPLSDGYFYLLLSLKLFSQKKSVLFKLPHLIILLPRLGWSNEIHFAVSWWGHSLLKETLCSNDISLNWERVYTAMKLFPYCYHFQITSVGTTTIFNLSFTVIKGQISHQILIKLRIRFVVKTLETRLRDLWKD